MSSMKVLLIGAALMLFFVAAMLFLVSERKNSGRLPPSGRYQVTGYITGDFSNAPWAGTVARLGDEQALIPPSGRFNFAVPPGSYTLGVCCSPEFQAIEQTVEVVDRDIELQLAVQPLIAVSGTIFAGPNPSLQGVAISATLQGTSVVNHAVSDANGRFGLRLGEGRWHIRLDNLPEGYAKAELYAGGSKIEDSVLVVAPLPRTISLDVRLTGR